LRGRVTRNRETRQTCGLPGFLLRRKNHPASQIQRTKRGRGEGGGRRRGNSTATDAAAAAAVAGVTFVGGKISSNAFRHTRFFGSGSRHRREESSRMHSFHWPFRRGMIGNIGAAPENRRLRRFAGRRIRPFCEYKVTPADRRKGSKGPICDCEPKGCDLFPLRGFERSNERMRLLTSIALEGNFAHAHVRFRGSS
jgi:hypothetical protein